MQAHLGYINKWGDIMSRKALLVIDMLEDFIAPDGALTVGEPGEGIVNAVASEIKLAREENLPILYLCDRHRPDDPEFQVWPPHCIDGTPGAEIVRTLAPVNGDFIVPKRRFSGFFESQLDLYLRELEVDKLILTGVCTNICVLYTACDARMRNYSVEVVKDAVATFSKEAHQFALKEMESNLGCRIR